jgi:hypothetical protein
MSMIANGSAARATEALAMVAAATMQAATGRSE